MVSMTDAEISARWIFMKCIFSLLSLFVSTITRIDLKSSCDTSAALPEGLRPEDV
jgi:hypothetical protein